MVLGLIETFRLFSPKLTLLSFSTERSPQQPSRALEALHHQPPPQPSPNSHILASHPLAHLAQSKLATRKPSELTAPLDSTKLITPPSLDVEPERSTTVRPKQPQRQRAQPPVENLPPRHPDPTAPKAPIGEVLMGSLLQRHSRSPRALSRSVA